MYKRPKPMIFNIFIFTKYEKALKMKE